MLKVHSQHVWEKIIVKHGDTGHWAQLSWCALTSDSRVKRQPRRPECWHLLSGWLVVGTRHHPAPLLPAQLCTAVLKPNLQSREWKWDWRCILMLANSWMHYCRSNYGWHGSDVSTSKQNCQENFASALLNNFCWISIEFSGEMQVRWEGIPAS